MQIVWYSPTQDKIVVQEFSQDDYLGLIERITTYDPLPFNPDAMLRDVVSHCIGDIMEKTNLQMLYGSDFHWLEQGLWVRIGEV